MNPKDKDSKTFNDKLKQFFRINKGNYKSREDVELTPDMKKLICPETPMHQRTRAIKDLTESVQHDNWEDRAAERLWNLVQDLLAKDVPRESRHVTLNFLCCLVQGQYSRMSSLMRVKFFMVVKEHDHPEDIGFRLELLQKLTGNGKDILHLEEKMGPFLLEWMPTVTGGDGKRGAQFLSLLVNVIKYNSAYIDEDIISGLVQYICHLCYYSNSSEVVSGCLNTLDTIVGYNINLKSDSLQTFITALCRSVNVECYCQVSWDIMRKLLGTHMGHSALHTMCRLLQDPTFQRDVRMLRGAVFFVNMGLWGTHRIPKLHCRPISVLPSFIQALKCNHPIVMYEVTLSVQRLVNKFGADMQEPTWSVVLDIIEEVIAHTETSNQLATRQVSSSLHETINSIENLLDSFQYNGCYQRFYDLVERCSDARPESSIFKLIDYRSSLISPTYSKWQSKLSTLMERYYKIETRTNIRVKVLEVLARVIQVNRSRYEDELIERIIVPALQSIDTDPDIIVRNVAATLLVDLCLECETKRCLELLDILEKMINRPFTSDQTITADSDVKDTITAVMGVIKVLTAKIYILPSNHAIRAYKILVGHLEQHYKEPHIFHEVSTVRHLIFECFLKIRASSLYHLGFPEPTTGLVSHFSSYLVLEHGQTLTDRIGSSGGGNSPPPLSPAPLQHTSCQITHLSLAHACKVVISCIKQEKDWKVLQLILKEMPGAMQNRALILTRQSNDIDYLAAALCSMFSDSNLRLPESLYNVPQKFTLPDFRVNLFPVLTSLASYHAHLEPHLQKRLIQCLELGLPTKYASQCVTSLTTCILEMRDAMNKLLEEVLLNLSKISATVHIAIPILEFLSTLTRLPKIFASFIGDQYSVISMSVFAILLPYTNPFKYNHYTVSLAHHVIAVWFLKCRLSFRPNSVRYITTGLKANVLVPFEEGHLINEDSSNRKRSSSLTEQGSRERRDRPIMPNRILGNLKPPIDEALMTFHVELTETCIDLMARYTFSTYTARPKRLPATNFLLKEGQSMTWLLGNKLITITTSGCSKKAMRSGLCDNCWVACKTVASTPDSKSGPGAPRRTSSTEGSREEIRLSRQSSGGNAGSSANTAANSPTEETKKTLDESEFMKQSGNIKAEKEVTPEPSKLEQILGGEKIDDHTPCACWCQGWAEIYVRRPTGDMSWIMRIQNSTQLDEPTDFPAHDITTLYMPTPEMVSTNNQSQDTTSTELPDHEIEERTDASVKSNLSEQQPTNLGKTTEPIAIPGSPGSRPSPSRQSSRDSTESLEGGEEDSIRSRNPVRRSNSSPEMSASWKNPFLNKDKLIPYQNEAASAEFDVKLDAELKKHAKNAYTKDMRVSCEAIPEEILGMGTTPPSVESANENPLATLNSGNGNMNNNTNINNITNNYINSNNNNNNNNNTLPPSPTANVQASAYLTVQSRAVQLHAPPSKPPQSPTQLYSRSSSTTDSSLKQNIQSNDSKPPIGRTYEKKEERPDPSSLPPIPFRDRGHTISVMSPARSRSDWDNIRRGNPPPRTKETPRTGINPSFVFLQLYHTLHFGMASEKPLIVPQTTAVQRAVTNLDRIQPYETHKIGVLYIGPGQASNEVEILANEHGSLRYTEFLQRLGTLVRLKDLDESIFLGGLDRNGENGNFAYIWQDDVTQVAFHVATLMPTKSSDPKCTSKKQHIGNNYVSVIYNESGEAYNIQTVKGQFNYACVVIQPLDHGTNHVTVQAREELAEHIGHSEPKIISDQNLAILSRQLALHANLASMVSSSLKQNGHNPYASNWLERLRHIKRLRNRVLQESSNSNSDGPSDELSTRPNKRVHMDDFTEYTT